MIRFTNQAITFGQFLRDIYRNRSIIFTLSMEDFRQQYLDNVFGILWAFVGPMVQVSILWFVFQVGFRSAPVDNIPFIVWLLPAFFSWMFIQEVLTNGTRSIVDRSYLVKKVVFRVSTLPIIKIITALIVHFFFVFLMIVVNLFYGIQPSLYYLQFFYYLFATIILLLGISWATAAIIIFFRDIGQIIAIILQFGFWVTPIFWSLRMLPEKYAIFIKMNPFFYITQGYRETFIGNVWFWEHWILTLYFWVLASFFFVSGAFIFRRLRPHFADVL